MKSLYPVCFETREEKSFQKLMSLMPSCLEMKKGQKWKGTRKKYIFVHSVHGEFKKTPNGLYGAWKKGLSGHPKDGASLRAQATSKKIKNLTTGKVFDSLAEAAKFYKLKTGASISIAAIKNKNSCGCRWAYVE